MKKAVSFSSRRFVKTETSIRKRAYFIALSDRKSERKIHQNALRFRKNVIKKKSRVIAIKERLRKANLYLECRKRAPSAFEVKPEHFGLYDPRSLWKWVNESGEKFGKGRLGWRFFKTKLAKAKVPMIRSKGRCPTLYIKKAAALVFPEYLPADILINSFLQSEYVPSWQNTDFISESLKTKSV